MRLITARVERRPPKPNLCYNSPMPTGVYPRPTNEERFHRSYVLDPQTGCWNWSLSLINGYGQFTVQPRRRVLAHVFSYTSFVGPIPSGKQLHHTCENRKCANYNHLVPLTPSEHMKVSPGSVCFENTRKEQCPVGHPLIEGNLDRTQAKYGNRMCLICRRRLVVEYKKRRKATQAVS